MLPAAPEVGPCTHHADIFQPSSALLHTHPNGSRITFGKPRFLTHFGPRLGPKTTIIIRVVWGVKTASKHLLEHPNGCSITFGKSHFEPIFVPSGSHFGALCQNGHPAVTRSLSRRSAARCEGPGAHLNRFEVWKPQKVGGSRVGKVPSDFEPSSPRCGPIMVSAPHCVEQPENPQFLGQNAVRSCILRGLRTAKRLIPNHLVLASN